MKQKNNPTAGFFVKILGNEKYGFITIPVFSIVVSLSVGAILILLLGKNPIEAYGNLLQGSGILVKEKYAGTKGMLTDFLSFVDYWTPMIFAALAVAVALKTGLFNIGVSGQMLAAGFVASVTVGYSALAAPIAKLLVIIFSFAVGSLVGGLIGFLKHKFKINEVVSSIMFNYIVEYITAFFIYTKYVEPVSRQSKNVSDAARLTLKNVPVGELKADIPLGIILAIMAAFVITYIFDKTTLGYELKAIGFNGHASRYAGMNVGKNIVVAMMISGGLAGLAGATYYLGYYCSIQPKVLAGLGYDAIAVSLLGNSNPAGILASSFLINIINKGSTYMSSKAGLDREIASVITGLLLLFSACSAYIQYLVKKKKDKLEEKIREET